MMVYLYTKPVDVASLLNRSNKGMQIVIILSTEPLQETTWSFYDIIFTSYHGFGINVIFPAPFLPSEFSFILPLLVNWEKSKKVSIEMEETKF